MKAASTSWSKRSCSRPSLEGLTSVTDDGGGHIFLVGGSNPEPLSLTLLPLRCCDACFVKVNDFNFTSELEEGKGECVLVGWETLDGWTTSVCVLFTMGLLSLSGALLLDAVCRDEFPDGFREDIGATLGCVSQLVCSPSVKEEKISVSLKKSYKRNECLRLVMKLQLIFLLYQRQRCPSLHSPN